jgi:hypothetical protein
MKRTLPSPAVSAIEHKHPEGSNAPKKAKLLDSVKRIERILSTGKVQNQGQSFSEKIERLRGILRETKTGLRILQPDKSSFLSVTTRPIESDNDNRVIINTHCAALLPNNKEWILAKVLWYHPISEIVVVCDEDDDANAVYNVKLSNVISLSEVRERFLWIDSLQSENRVLALYPDTTTFYPGVIDSLDGEFTNIRFDGDTKDDDGVIMTKRVPTKFIAKRLK